MMSVGSLTPGLVNRTDWLFAVGQVPLHSLIRGAAYFCNMSSNNFNDLIGFLENVLSQHLFTSCLMTDRKYEQPPRMLIVVQSQQDICCPNTVGIKMVLYCIQYNTIFIILDLLKAANCTKKSHFQQKLVCLLHLFPQHHYANFHFDYTFFVSCMTNGVLIRPWDNTCSERSLLTNSQKRNL